MSIRSSDTHKPLSERSKAFCEEAIRLATFNSPDYALIAETNILLLEEHMSRMLKKDCILRTVETIRQLKQIAEEINHVK